MLISLTTDFGDRDGYVGIMKGVMAAIAPGVTFVDLSHAIPPQDLRSAAYVLWTALPYFPPESVHLVVVDPGVGTSRKPIAARTAWGTLVGPDNGVFSYVWEVAPPTMVVELCNPRYRRAEVCATFHGRDIFSPAAAHLARGVPLEDFGPPVAEPVRLPLPILRVHDNALHGEVLYADHFGNLITSIGRLAWESAPRRGAQLRFTAAFGAAPELLLPSAHSEVFVAGRSLGPVRRTYGEVAPGEALALVGSEGLLEIAISHGNAAANLGLPLGAPVTVQLS
ncbi:MAG: SAM-dependent chlorinase/fluorinase [Anaerolineae bacterium]|jgi:S-adenosylmethionine hydrolase|nr:SAM-dependent chlorinase/fluorinase [Anaerolineae bacterium]